MRAYDTAQYRQNKRELARTTLPRCASCGTTRNLECDHIVELHEGGDNSISNLQWLCRSCNMAKSWRKRRQRAVKYDHTGNPVKPQALVIA